MKENKMIQVSVNDDTLDIDDASSLLSLLQVLGREKDKRIAIALNNTVIPKTAWESTFLNEGDKIVLITAAYGG